MSKEANNIRFFMKTGSHSFGDLTTSTGERADRGRRGVDLFNRITPVLENEEVTLGIEVLVNTLATVIFNCTDTPEERRSLLKQTVGLLKEAVTSNDLLRACAGGKQIARRSLSSDQSLLSLCLFGVCSVPSLFDRRRPAYFLLVVSGAQRETTVMSETAKTLAEFLAAKRISKSTYYALKKRGLGPIETVYPGSRVIRISPAAERAFEERIAALAQSDAARLEAARRREIATLAGKIAIKSPNHVTRRRQSGGRARRVRG